MNYRRVENVVLFTLMGVILAGVALFGFALLGIFGAILLPLAMITFIGVLFGTTSRRVRRDPARAAADAERLTTEMGKLWARGSGGWAAYDAQASPRHARDDEDAG